MAVTIDQQRCVGCGCCSDVCSAGALELNDKAVVYAEHCIECGACVEMCPALAIAPG
ncbi:4Fe-4S binding protein [Thermodesulfobacteriota bacterium]